MKNAINTRKKAYTLIELVLVLMIGGILAAIAAPSMFDLQGISKNSFFTEIKYGLNYAQKYASSKRMSVYISISLNQIKICSVSDCSSVINLNGNDLVYNAPSGTSIITNPNTTLFSYDYLGTPSINQKLTISIGAKNLYIEQSTGYVHE